MVFDPAENTDLWMQRLKTYQSWDPQRYLLKFPADVCTAEQLRCYPKARRKFPTLHTDGMAYTRLALEQSSGEAAALFKSSLITGASLIDLTGGLGMDSLAFSRVANHVYYVEPVRQPYLLARRNHTLWGAANISWHACDAREALHTLPGCDWAYIDPSRRHQDRRSFLLSDCEPDVTAMWDELRSHSRNIMVKLSPLYDLKALDRELPGLTRILVVSVQGEVKEILALSESTRAVTEPEVHAVCLPGPVQFSAQSAVPEVQVPLADVRAMIQTAAPGGPDTGIGKDVFTDGNPIGENTALVVPDAAVIKAGLTDQLAMHFNLKRLNYSTDFLVGRTRFHPGATSYPIENIREYKPRQLKQDLRGLRVHIHPRSFPEDTRMLYRRLGLQMGEDAHLFFTRLEGGIENGLIVIKTGPAIASS
ncbi:MAG: N6-adenine-specific methylase [Bacteroidetes bacterium HLUCCA01]|nr:MAG: N6-adenine-specific methylase [Bacteroidetes bacterium HLUCCA01]